MEWDTGSEDTGGGGSGGVGWEMLQFLDPREVRGSGHSTSRGPGKSCKTPPREGHCTPTFPRLCESKWCPVLARTTEVVLPESDGFTGEGQRCERGA